MISRRRRSNLAPEDAPLSRISANLFMWIAATSLVAAILISAIADIDADRAWNRYPAAVCGLAALVFIFPPMFTLRHHGQVKPGQDYMQTCRVVDRGLFGVIRHPQYFGYILIAVTFMLVTPHWMVFAPGVLSIVMFYLYAIHEERTLEAKFGEAYREYTRRVPRFNVVAGAWRRLRRARPAP